MSRKIVRDNIFDQKYQALSDTYLFLIGIAFENLIKGLILSKEPAIKNLSELNNKYDWNDKHNITSMITNNFNSLDKDDIKAIKRAEEYVKWAGKYPLTKTVMPFNNVDYNLKSKDKENMENLFFKIKDAIKMNWLVTQEDYFQWLQP